MESKSIIHNFLSARTIMVGGATATAASRVCKVGSFAFARKLQGGSSYEAPDGVRLPSHIKWTAPEAARRERRLFSIKSDVWSFGITLIEMVTYGNAPYV